MFMDDKWTTIAIKEPLEYCNSNDFVAEGMGLEPTRLLHPTRFPGELLSHSVNPPDP